MACGCSRRHNISQAHDICTRVCDHHSQAEDQLADEKVERASAEEKAAQLEEDLEELNYILEVSPIS